MPQISESAIRPISISFIQLRTKLGLSSSSGRSIGAQLVGERKSSIIRRNCGAVGRFMWILEMGKEISQVDLIHSSSLVIPPMVPLSDSLLPRLISVNIARVEVLPILQRAPLIEYF